MQTPAIPANESERIHALQASHLLDSEYEAIFDNLTALVSRIFDVPIVAISLVDSDRQWFKSIYGLNVCQTGRDVSFCGHVVADNNTLIVENTAQDERFADNPLVTEGPRIVFYAGVRCVLLKTTIFIPSARCASLIPSHESLAMTN